MITKTSRAGAKQDTGYMTYSCRQQTDDRRISDSPWLPTLAFAIAPCVTVRPGLRLALELDEPVQVRYRVGVGVGLRLCFSSEGR